MRKAKATSISGAVLAMQNAQAPAIRPPWKLDKERMEVWREIIERRARDEWQPVDLRFACELADLIVTRHAESAKLEAEGSVVDGKINARFLAVTQLSNRAMRLATYLRIHPSSDRPYNPAMVRQDRIAERDARDTLAGFEDDHLLPGILPGKGARN